MIEKVATLEDGRLDAYARLTDPQLRNRLEPELGLFIAESAKVIGRALDAGAEPVSLLVDDRRLEAERALVERFERERPSLPVLVAPHSQLAALTGFEVTRGALAAFRRPVLPEADELLTQARRVAVLEDVTNHTNVGAVFRSAAALGMDAVLVTPGCYDPLYRRALRVSMGTVLQVPWAYIGADASGAPHGNAVRAGTWSATGVPLLHRYGFKVAAMALRDDSVGLDEPGLADEERLAVVLGTEGEGLADATIERCDCTVRIPMAHGVDSLNVAAASAVAFWELRARG